MARAATFGLFGFIEGPMNVFKIGCHVRIRKSVRSPLTGEAGRVVEIRFGDPHGDYLVQFAGGLRFRYQKRELELLE